MFQVSDWIFSNDAPNIFYIKKEDSEKKLQIDLSTPCVPIGIVENSAVLGILYIREGVAFHAWFLKVNGDCKLEERVWTSVDIPLQYVLETDERIRQCAVEMKQNPESILATVARMKKSIKS